MSFSISRKLNFHINDFATNEAYKSEQIVEIANLDEAKLGETFYLTQAEIFSNGYVSETLVTCGCMAALNLTKWNKVGSVLF